MKILSKQDTIQLSAEILGLEETLEDNILEIMDNWIKESMYNGAKETLKNISDSKSLEVLESYIRNIVYDILQEQKNREHKEKIYNDLEGAGFIKDCPTCTWNIKKYGKLKGGI